MKLSFTGTFDFDYYKELARIHRCFEDEEKERQILILKTFWKDKDINRAIELYNDLPYNDKDECPEQEFVGQWFRTICTALVEYPAFLISDIVIDNSAKIS